MDLDGLEALVINMTKIGVDEGPLWDSGCLSRLRRLGPEFPTSWTKTERAPMRGARNPYLAN